MAEVLSPSETPRMIHRKLKQYFEAGVKEVWLIDPEVREIEVWTGPSLPSMLSAAMPFWNRRCYPASRCRSKSCSPK